MKNLQDYYEDWKKLEQKKCLKGQEALEAVKKNGYTLQYVENPSEEMCLEAVKKDGYALRYIENPSEEMCLEAVKEDRDALQYVPENMFDKVKQCIVLDGVKYVRA